MLTNRLFFKTKCRYYYCFVLFIGKIFLFHPSVSYSQKKVGKMAVKYSFRHFYMFSNKNRIAPISSRHLYVLISHSFHSLFRRPSVNRNMRIRNPNYFSLRNSNHELLFMRFFYRHNHDFFDGWIQIHDTFLCKSESHSLNETSKGKLCIEVAATSKIAWISEELCIGCGICVKVCRIVYEKFFFIHRVVLSIHCTAWYSFLHYDSN